MVVEDFFDESTEQSQIKSDIVAKYFWSWAKVILPAVKKSGGRIAYIDLFAGPGKYKSGKISTPLKVLMRIIHDPIFNQHVFTIFNDVDRKNYELLQNAIQELEGIEKLKYPPEVLNVEIGESFIKEIEQMAAVPTLLFVDPWGYKGLSLKLIKSVLKNWGSDCIVFFNYNRINMGLQNEKVRSHMEALFGVQRTARLREQTEKLLPSERESRIIEELSQALKEIGGDFVHPFEFSNSAGTRISHYLLLVSKHPKAFNLWKEITAKVSSSQTQGVASFEFNPKAKKQRPLFDLEQPLDDLGEELLKRFAGQTLTVEQIFNTHNILSNRFILKNYKDILKKLEEEGKVTADPPADRRRKHKGEVTLADQTKIIFPE